MGDSFVIENVATISNQMATIRESIEEARTIYQARKKNLEDQIQHCEESIQADVETKRMVELTKQRCMEKISEKQSQISSTKNNLETARQELDRAKDADNGKYGPAVRSAETRVLHLESQWRRQENELRAMEKEKVGLDRDIQMWENRIAHKRTLLGKILAMYQKLTGEGARELERTIQEGNATIARLKRLLDHASSRPEM